MFDDCNCDRVDDDDLIVIVVIKKNKIHIWLIR